MAKRTSTAKLRQYIRKVVEEEVSRVLGSQEPEQRFGPDEMSLEPPPPPETLSPDEQPVQSERANRQSTFPPEHPFESSAQPFHQPPQDHWDAPPWPPLHEPMAPYPEPKHRHHHESGTHKKNRR